MECKFRENLRDELNYQGVTVKELAGKTGISKRTIENYLSSKGTLPPVDYACKIASVLNISVEALVSGAPFKTDGGKLSAKSKSILNDMEKLSAENQDLLIYMIHAAASKTANEKQEPPDF